MSEERYVKQIVSDVMEMAAKIKFLEAKVAASESWNAECVADAQATVEALQRERDEANLYRDQARANQESLAACVDRDVRKIKDLQAALDVERERSEKQAEEAMVVFSKLTQLQALVRALPVVEVDGVTVWAAPDESGWFVSKRPAPTGTYWAQFKTQEEADSFLALLRYRAALDATTPAPIDAAETHDRMFNHTDRHPEAL